MNGTFKAFPTADWVSVLFGELEQQFFVFFCQNKTATVLTVMHRYKTDTINLHISRINVSNLCYSLQTTMGDRKFNRFKTVNSRLSSVFIQNSYCLRVFLLIIDRFISFSYSSDVNFVILLRYQPWISHIFFGQHEMKMFCFNHENVEYSLVLKC